MTEKNTQKHEKYDVFNTVTPYHKNLTLTTDQKKTSEKTAGVGSPAFRRMGFSAFDGLASETLHLVGATKHNGGQRRCQKRPKPSDKNIICQRQTGPRMMAS